MRRTLVGLALLCFGFTANVSAQSTNATVAGFVQDPTQAFIPGVTVTATNTGTGVVSTALTNELGAYNFPSLLPGSYELAAELPGFQTQVIEDVQLGGGVAARYNFTLQVGGVAQTVEVIADATAVLAETSASIGQVLTEDVVQNLPLVSNNVLDLMRTMAGVRGDGLGTGTTFAGLSTRWVNTVRDGLSVQEGRYNSGVGSTTLVNPDLVGELRVILTPVDAELGRGNGQVQILTRSGTNQYRGAVVWANRNSAFDANTWNNNRQIVRGEWAPGLVNWVNRNQITASLGGPIVRNQTFFFALYDQQFERRRVMMRPEVLTACAQRGIFRYWEGWGNGNINQVTSRTGANPTIQSVDSFGNPLRPETWPNGTPYTGDLQFFSVFGPLANTPSQPDCSDAQLQAGASPWNALRPGMDPIGQSQRYLDLMPQPNIFDAGDGLNTAVHQWQRAGRNGGEFGIATGTNLNTPRQQINVKLDHNFNAEHRIAGSFSYDRVRGDYIPSVANPQIWPGGISSPIERSPRVLTVNLTSTLAPTVLNEFRFGYRANKHWVYAPWERPDDERDLPESLLLEGGGGYPIAYVPASVGGMTPNQFSCVTNCAQQGNRTPLTVIANTVSWTRGVHAFKFGGEYRTQFTEGSETPQAPIPKATGGAGLNPNQAFSNNPAMPGLVSNNQNLANQLLYFLSGSVNSAQQYYYIVNPDDTDWSSYLDGTRKVTRADQNEIAFFFKDDWKIHPSFTLNLGVRYDYYGVPFEGNGMSPVPVGGALGLMGVSGRSFDRWLRPDNPIDLSLLTEIELVGPKTSQPDKSIYGNDYNNIAPAVGFAWQVPGGTMTLRGGYQISNVGGNGLSDLVNFIFVNQGFLNLAQTQGPVDGSYFSTEVLHDLIPIAPTNTPLAPIPLIKPTQAGNAYDSNLRNPYIQNFTLSLTREVTRTLSTEIKYVGTMGLKLLGQYNLNIPNVYHNPALFEALEITRGGGDSPLFDQIFMGLNLNPGSRGCDPANPTAFCAPVDGVSQRGSAHVRASSTFRSNLANGDFAAVANSLNYYNGAGSGPAGAVPGVPGERGTVLRRANENYPGQFPANWISLNPQLNAANYYTNSGRSNYHSLQIQNTLRPTAGISFSGTYIWSRAMEVPGSGYTDPTRRELDYRLQANHVSHDFRAFGAFELPFGPGRSLLGGSSGVLARIVEGWETSYLLNVSSGQAATISAGDMLYGNGVPDVVGPFSANTGEVRWEGDFGSYFPDGAYEKVPDIQCSQVATALQPYCTLQAVTDGSGRVLLQNPQPGQVGTLGQRTMYLPGSWALDVAMSKTIQVNESMRLQVRVDSTNIFNHPGPGTPNLDINANNAFGFIQAKDNDRRSFKAQIRLDF